MEKTLDKGGVFKEGGECRVILASFALIHLERLLEKSVFRGGFLFNLVF